MPAKQKAGGGKSKKGYQTTHNKAHYDAQWKKTAKNVEKRRRVHAEKHPNDLQALVNWKSHPPLYK